MLTPQKIIKVGSKEILEGCDNCGSKFFFYVREEHLKPKEPIIKLNKGAHSVMVVGYNDNLENPDDYEIIDVLLTTPKNKIFNFDIPIFDWLFECFTNILPTLRNFLRP